MNRCSDDDIRWLLALLEDERLAEIEVEDGDCAISVKAPTADQPLAIRPAVTEAACAANDPQELPDHFTPLLAPIAGTFYRASSPDARPFVEVGDIVEVGDTLGLVEAMKLYHDVNSPVRGRIAQVLAENQAQVQAEQHLMTIDRNV